MGKKPTPLTATVRFRRVTVESVNETRSIDPTDLITLVEAASILQRDISTVSRWVGSELPEVTLLNATGRTRRYTLRAELRNKNRDLTRMSESGVRLLSDYGENASHLVTATNV